MDRVSEIAALLKSTAPDHQQLQDAASLGSIVIPTTDVLLNPSFNTEMVQWHPIHARLLQWLLSKLSKQEPLPDSAITDPLSYILLYGLLSLVPERLLPQYFQSTDIVEILCKCLVYSRYELAQCSSKASELREKALSKPKKRRLSLDRAETIDSERSNCIMRLAAICRLLALFEQFRNGQLDYRFREIMKNLLKIPYSKAGLIIKSGLWCVIELISIANLNIEDTAWTWMTKALISVWRFAHLPVEVENTLDSPQLFAEHCLLPCLILQVEMPELDLQDFIYVNCVYPLMYSLTRDGEQTKNHVSALISGLSQLQNLDSGESREILSGLTFTGSHGVSQNALRSPKCIGILVETLGRYRPNTKSSSIAISELWFNEMFIQLMRFLDIDIELTTLLKLDENQYQALEGVLAAHLSIKQSPGLDILASLIMYLNEASPASNPVDTWKLIGLCLRIAPELVAKMKKDPQDPDTRGIMWENLLSIDEFELIAREDNDNNKLEFFLESLLDAMVQQRAMLHFIPLWKTSVNASLQRILNVDSKISKNCGQMFWENKNVRSAITRRLSQFVAVSDLVTSIRTMLVELKQHASDPRPLPSVYGLVITMHTLIEAMSHKEVKDTDTSWALQLFEVLSNYYRNHLDHETVYLVLDVLLKLDMIAEAIPGKPLEQTLLCAQAQVQKMSHQSAHKYGAYRHGLAALDFVNMYSSRLESAQELAQSIFDTLSTELSPDKAYRFEQTEPGNFSQTQFLCACVDLYAETSWIFREVKHSSLQQFTDHIFKHACQRSTLDPHLWRLSWSKLTRCDANAEERSLFSAVRSSRLTEALLNDQHIGDVNDNGSYEFILEDLQKVDPRTIPKSTRAKLINHLTSNLKTRDLSPALVFSSLRLLEGLLERIPVPATSGLNSSTEEIAILRDPDTIWIISASLKNRYDIDYIEWLHSITTKVTKHWFANKDSTKTMLKHVSKQLAKKLRNSDQGQITVWDITIASSIFSNIDAADVQEYSKLKHLQTDLPTLLLQRLRLSERVDGILSDSVYILLSDLLLLFPSTIQSSIDQGLVDKSRVEQHENELIKLNEQFLNLTRASTNSNADKDRAACCWLLSQQILQRFHETQKRQLILEGSQLDYMSYESGRRRIYQLRKEYQELPPEDKAHVLNALYDCGSEMSLPRLIQLKKIASLPLPLEQRTNSVKAAFCRVFSHSMQKLACEGDVNLLVTHLMVAEIILDINPWVTTQEHVDHALGTVIMLTSQKHTVEVGSKDSVAAHHILSALIRLLGVVFQNHRRKIGGRWHLVIDALKGILRCFFVPYDASSTKATIPQPLWIRNIVDKAATEKTVNSFSRLLSSICDPTHKALKSRSNNNDVQHTLNDASKAARAISGQQMQNFIAEFCSLQLKGKIINRDAIKPGLYAIFDAMTQDVQKSLNESLDQPSRIMFKNLYEDWKRTGKWTES